ncbi:hypothetical protein KSW81_002826 [Nannochloris sp. 'desiccata']|nr:hypothetical protein KSW81_002826 [Chlorella desiccata (nom. nud.)]
MMADLALSVSKMVLDKDEVRSAFHERLGLVAIDGGQVIEIDLAVAGVFDIGAERERLVGRPDGSGDKARTAIAGGEFVRQFARDAGGSEVDFAHQPFGGVIGLADAAEQVAGRVGQLRPVEGVEVELLDVLGIEAAAEFGGDGGGHVLAGAGEHVEPFHQFDQPVRHVRAALRRQLAGARKVGDGQDAGHDRLGDSRRRRAVAEAEEAFRREEELGDRPVRAGIELALEVVDLGLRAFGFRMALGIGRDRNLERVQGLEARDQIGGAGIAFGVRREGGTRRARITSQRDDMADAHAPEAFGGGVGLGLACAHAGEVRGHRHIALAHHAGNRGKAALARGAAGAVGDADEARSEAGQRLQCFEQLVLGNARSRGEEFERHFDIAGQAREDRGGGEFGRLRGEMGNGHAVPAIRAVDGAAGWRLPVQMMVAISPPGTLTGGAGTKPAWASALASASSPNPSRVWA